MMSPLDIGILISLAPLLLVLITWWLPWKRFFEQAPPPAQVAGPDLLHAAFAAWHFNWPWWVVSLTARFGIIFSASAVREYWKTPGES
jgi:hypothetical protein